MPETEKELRWRIFRALLPYYGKIVAPDFLRKTSEFVSGIERIHPLIEGIYKPKWSDHALSIASMKINPYADKLTYLPDGRWTIKYSAKKGGPDTAANSGLFNCMKNKEPVIVLEQLSGKTGKQGARYRLMGLGLISNYAPASDIFNIEHVDFATLEQVSNGADEKVIIASALRSFTLEEFNPFISEDKTIYRVSSQKRSQAFKEVVLDQYGYKCAVTGVRYHSENLTEAQAAHIISNSKKGTDDPRNGISLSRTVHWSFDVGMFTISDQFEVVINPKAKLASANKFPILDMHGAQINLPEDENYYPHQEALDWHKKEVFNRFSI